MAKLVALVAAHRKTNDLRVVAAGGAGPGAGVSELVRDACASRTRARCPRSRSEFGHRQRARERHRVGKRSRRAVACALRPRRRRRARRRVDAWIWRATPLETGPDGRVLDVPRRNARPPPRVVGARALHDFDGNPGGDAGADGAAGPGGFFSAAAAASRDIRDGGPSSLRADASGISGSDPDPSPRRDPLSTNTLGGAPEHHHAGTSPESRRRSISAARRVAMESDDLPHLPELAFAPPPMTRRAARRATARRRRRTAEPARRTTPRTGRRNNSGGSNTRSRTVRVRSEASRETRLRTRSAWRVSARGRPSRVSRVGRELRLGGFCFGSRE